jgi:hypothetical protein
MKHFKTITIILFTVILSYSCTSEDDIGDQNNGGNEPAYLKVIESISQSQFGNLNIQLQNDRISRFYSASTTFYHHVNYDGTERIQNIYIEGTGNTNLPFQGFDYDYISDPNDNPEVIFTYDGSRLKQIRSSNLGDFDFFFDTQNRLQEVTLDDQRFEFIYESGTNPIAVLISRIQSTTQPKRFELVFDDKVNPFYTIWNDFGLPLSLAYGDLPDDAFVYFPNNLISMENLTDQEIFTITYQYDDEDHPSFYRYTDDQGRTRSGFFNYY